MLGVAFHVAPIWSEPAPANLPLAIDSTGAHRHTHTQGAVKQSTESGLFQFKGPWREWWILLGGRWERGLEENRHDKSGYAANNPRGTGRARMLRLALENIRSKKISEAVRGTTHRATNCVDRLCIVRQVYLKDERLSSMAAEVRTLTARRITFSQLLWYYTLAAPLICRKWRSISSNHYYYEGWEWRWWSYGIGDSPT